MQHQQISPVDSLPVTRPEGCPFDPPQELGRIREANPITRMTYPDGHVGRLVTGHALTRAVLADTRFSSRYELMHFPLPIPGVTESPPAPVGDLTGIDAPEHTRYRRLLTGRFTVRRMRVLTERVEQITAEHLDAMENHGPSVDLVEAFAHPVPAMMICELLGVPYEDRATFNFALLNHPDQLAALCADPSGVDLAVEELLRYLTITHTNVRAALEDVELDGHLIRAGETVTLAVQTANRDPERFPDPDTLDLSRQATGHLAFGHGIHQCLGQQLARVEMRVALPALFGRFPTLRLAVPAEDVPLRHERWHGVGLPRPVGRRGDRAVPPGRRPGFCSSVRNRLRRAVGT